jgi:protease I
MKKAIILAGAQIQDHEFIYPFYRLKEDGYHVDVAVRNKETVLGSMGVRIVPTIDIPEVFNSEHQILLIPGGAKAMEYMRQDRQLIEAIAYAHSRRVVIAAICHGAQLLISAGLVRGRRISGYYSIRELTLMLRQFPTPA